MATETPLWVLLGLFVFLMAFATNRQSSGRRKSTPAASRLWVKTTALSPSPGIRSPRSAQKKEAPGVLLPEASPVVGRPTATAPPTAGRSDIGRQQLTSNKEAPGCCSRGSLG